ncbi:NAD(P)-dependent oxidoreductase [Candidatus Pelagibacter sp.]|nr:NAD(P)-dependent oxidoreductase [Candidatus Pelagibacter sp.]
MAILITGVSGFIGRYLAKEFLKKKYKVYGVYRKNKPKIKNKNFRPLKIDLTRKFIIPNDINSIFHLAADSPENVNSINLINNNIKSTKNLINSVKNIKIKNFYFFSSIAVYEKFKNKRVLLKEKLKNLNPISNYSKSKYLSEKLIIKKIDKTINLLVFRLPAVVAKDSFLSAFYNIKKKIKNNELLTIINPNQKFNGIIHISDLIRIIISIF